MLRITTLFSAVLLSAGLISSAAQAQETQGTTAPFETQASDTNFSDEQLQQFATAAQEISTVSGEYSQRLQQAEDEMAQQTIREEANNKMIEVVQNSGLDIETFNAIGQAAQNDPALAQRIQQFAQSGS
ncbi:DUF4168 domain-containing protein [Halomonas huangheensis]|uniref:DUF4168 domain-containing protein n=1 Tax=Halomonas huangheensis TaxID=1178482 RepID=W1NBA3_9GAMM|nr:DUF4168 domain-containing protein [Halomonas huangheensis]ALM52697.1 hypothetical protein AR456_10720 [Halomonas huangheensis]ERL52773.1 hypothetical protein BJB45_15955 [Halomonas huangheensis]